MENNMNNKKLKKIVTIIFVLVILLGVIVGIVNWVKKTPERVVKKFVKAANNGDEDKIIDLIDVKGRYAFEECDRDDDEFKDEYKTVTDEEVEEYLEEDLDGIEYNWLDDFTSFEDYDSIEIKKIKKVKKLDGNIYKVRAKVEFEEDDYDFSPYYDFYIFKNKIIYIDEN